MLFFDFLEVVAVASEEAGVEDAAAAVESLAAFLLFLDFLVEVAAVSEEARLRVVVLAESLLLFLLFFDFVDFVLAVALSDGADELEAAD